MSYSEIDWEIGTHKCTKLAFVNFLIRSTAAAIAKFKSFRDVESLDCQLGSVL